MVEYFFYHTFPRNPRFAQTQPSNNATKENWTFQYSQCLLFDFTATNVSENCDLTGQAATFPFLV